jgi:hypothetical protein
MKLNPPKKNTFWVSVAIAAIGVIIYIVHGFAQTIPHLSLIGFLLVLAGFVLLCLGLTLKGL